ncbi:DUF389 domain-containing protein [Sphingomonas sp. HF-S4]|uniref:DUF389 domain-containing protein n=1 Tax=Sphingomonas agrestis TaxID=3080540 RepID=A0ABU3YAZ5_9SPHN|nr:DUF389 domain-containing protein [Sphingomonas sp. HF-S4]MDV3458565.1 DUF389 domain-containing protein [Sphingomonas sp. HF-S4]
MEATPRRWAARNPVIAWWLRAISDVDHEAVHRRVVAEAGWSLRYALMIVLSVFISILGLLMPSSAVLIGAMLISPLMMPIIGLGFGIATFDSDEIRRAALALAAGAVIAVLLSAAFVAVSPVQTITSEIAGRTKPNLFDLLVALLSAVAGGYALIRGRGETVVGVAIAIALMPPLAVVGFGIATANSTVAGGALLLFFTNLITIALTAALVARLYGFGSHLSPSQTRLQGFLILVGLAALAVPLGLALKKIAWETVAQRQVRDAVRAPFPHGARISQLDVDFARHPAIVRAVVFTPGLQAGADAQVRSAVETALGVPVDLHIDQVRVSEELGAGEAAQIAAAQTDEPRRRADASVKERLALLAGIAPEAVMADTQSRRAQVVAAPLPGASLATYRALEARAAATIQGWQIVLQPPLLALPAITFDGDTPDADALATAIWAAQRLNQPITASGRRADEVVDLLAKAGVSAEREPGSGAEVTLRWAQP